MQDEELNSTQTQEVEELDQSTSGAEGQAEDQEQQEQETPEPQVEEQKEELPESPEVPEEAPVSRRENKRIQQLTKKLAESSQQLEQFQRPFSQPQQEDQIIGEGDYDIADINSRAKQYGDSRYQEGLAQANSLAFATRLEIDTPRVAQKHPELDQQSDRFDPGSAAFINELYLKSVGYDPNNGTVNNPNIRYEEFVDGIMDLRETLASAQNTQTQQNIAKQAAQTGVRPSGIAKKPYQGEDPSKMTTEQLEAAINQSLGLK